MVKGEISADKRWDITVKNNNSNKMQSVLLWAPIRYELSISFSLVQSHKVYRLHTFGSE